MTTMPTLYLSMSVPFSREAIDATIADLVQARDSFPAPPVIAPPVFIVPENTLTFTAAEIGATKNAVLGLVKHMKYHYMADEFWPLFCYLVVHGACSREAALHFRHKGPNDGLGHITDPFYTYWKQAVGQKDISRDKRPVVTLYEYPDTEIRQLAKGLLLQPAIKNLIDEMGGIEIVSALV